MHSIPLVALGTGLLWFGWYGFNAGSELKVDSVTALAFLNTDVAASFAAITWLVLAWIYERKPKFLGLLTGSIAGLAAVTPAAGYVTTSTAILIGIAASVVCYYAISLKNKMQWDDALDVWGVHGVGGMLGVFALAIFANKAVNPDGGADGLLHGNTAFFVKESLAVIGGGGLRVHLHVRDARGDPQAITPVTVTRRRRRGRARRVAPRRARVSIERAPERAWRCGSR